MKKPTTKSPDPLDALSHHISGAITSFFDLLKTWRQQAGAAVPTTQVTTKQRS